MKVLLINGSPKPNGNTAIALQEMVKVLEKEQIETNTSLAEFAEMLVSNDFVKPIRYALVALQAVKEVTADTLVLTDGTEIPVSREKRKEILVAFMQFQKV